MRVVRSHESRQLELPSWVAGLDLEEHRQQKLDVVAKTVGVVAVEPSVVTEWCVTPVPILPFRSFQPLFLLEQAFLQFRRWFIARGLPVHSERIEDSLGIQGTNWSIDSFVQTSPQCWRASPWLERGLARTPVSCSLPHSH